MANSYSAYNSISGQSNRKYRPSESSGIKEQNIMILNLFLETDFLTVILQQIKQIKYTIYD